MALPAPNPDSRVSVAEYLRREAEATDRHEYHDGEIFVMSGGSARHSRINYNLYLSIGKRLDMEKCEPFESTIKVAIRESRRYVYPDATIVCGPVEFDPEGENESVILNPRVIFEVLSPSTEGYDRGEKFEHYKHSPTIEEYVLIAQDRSHVDSILRQADGSWNWIAFSGLDATATVRCVGVELPLAELYSRVNLPSPGGEG